MKTSIAGSGIQEIASASYAAARELLSERARATNVLFRGQEDARWKLDSKLGRLRSQVKIVDEDADRWLMDLRARMLAAFRRESIMSSLLRDDELPMNETDDKSMLDIESVAQHYGLPTRLLDWSESPYVALFFAFGGHNRNIVRTGRVAVWCLDRGKLQEGEYQMQLKVELSGERNELLRRYSSRADALCLLARDLTVNTRIRRQRGWFSYMKKQFIPLDDYLQLHGDAFPPGTLTKITIADGAQREALLDLRDMGLTPISMFGGFEGVASEVWTECLRFQRSSDD